MTNPIPPTLPDTAGIMSSESLTNLGSALAAAQSQFKPVGKNSTNPHFNSKFADLASLIAATRDALSFNGLSLIQAPVFVNGRVNVVSRLLHKSGEWLETSISLKSAQDTPQAIGSVITYGRRYGLAALLGISADDDDDGNAATGKGPAAPLPPRSVKV